MIKIRTILTLAAISALLVAAGCAGNDAVSHPASGSASTSSAPPPVRASSSSASIGQGGSSSAAPQSSAPPVSSPHDPAVDEPPLPNAEGAAGEPLIDEPPLPDSEAGVIFRCARETYPPKTELIEANLINNSVSEHLYGHDYRIEYLDHGEWLAVPLELSFTMEAILLPAWENHTIEISLARDQYEYEPGRYRVVKEYFAGYERVPVYAEFELEGNG